MRDWLECPQCHGTFRFDELQGQAPHNLTGKIPCVNCEFFLLMEHGVISVAPPEVFSKERVFKVYGELWERVGEALCESRPLEEEEMIRNWSIAWKNNWIADVGAGNGRLANHWLDCGAKGVVFVEPSEGIYHCASVYFARQSSSYTVPCFFLRAKIENLPIRTRFFDVVWSSGTLGLIKEQKTAQLELQRICKQSLFLSVLTEKKWIPRFYLWANFFKPLINRIDQFDLLFGFCGIVARILWVPLFLKLRLSQRLTYRDGNQGNSGFGNLTSWKRLQQALYDPFLIPRVSKMKDSFYLQNGREGGFHLISHRTVLLSDYFEFSRT